MTSYQETADAAIPELAGLQRRFLLGGAVAAAIALVGLFVNPTQFFQSYLMAYMWCLGATLGCLALGMVHRGAGIDRLSHLCDDPLPAAAQSVVIPSVGGHICIEGLSSLSPQPRC